MLATLLLSAFLAPAPQAPGFARPVRLKANDQVIKVEAPGYAFPAWFDVDRDGVAELVVSQCLGGKMMVYPHLGRAKFGPGHWLEIDGQPAGVPGISDYTSSTPQLVDLDGDGIPDILSGSYSSPGPVAAGLFAVLRGKPGGGYAKAAVLNGADGRPLVVTPAAGAPGDRICTRPCAADLDGDGHLDLVVGTQNGAFAFFCGDGRGSFLTRNTWLKDEDADIRVVDHGDPCLFDWDGDGDLDLLSGASAGGVVWFQNLGSRTQPRFAAAKWLVAPPMNAMDDSHVGDGHLTGPLHCSRVNVADLDGDGRADLLIGDSVHLQLPAPGVSEAEARKALARYRDRRLMIETAPESGPKSRRAAAAKDRDALLAALEQERAKFLRDESTGFVWWLRRE